MKPRILYTKPSITDLEVRYASDAAANGWGDQCYAYIDKFEHSFCQHLGTRHAIATSSCTGALHMGMAALNIGAGDEVILANTNWIATVAPIVHLGAKPVFVDILPTTWCLDPVQVERAITPQTKAIVAVHLYGNLCDMQALLALGRKHGIAVIEDAAEAIGSVYHGQAAGSMGTFSAFSFHGTKTMTTGEGGMFVTNDSALYARVLTLSNHGRSRSQTRQFWPDELGYKYKMSNIQAALGFGQMQRIDALIDRKREIMRFYRDRLAALSGVSVNAEHDGTRIGAWMPTVVFDAKRGITREKLQAAFKVENIDARVFFYPLNTLPMFDGQHNWQDQSVSWSESIASRAINLPSYHDIRTDELQRVCDVIIQMHNQVGVPA
jgi:perosamine synthetase